MAGVEDAVFTHTAAIGALLPNAEVSHVGSTSVPGAVTKGDVDLLVSVPAAEFGAAIEALATRYRMHQRDNWTPTYASFTDPDAEDPPVGVQLAIAGSYEGGMFGAFADALRSDRDLLAAYNALKRGLHGEDYEAHTAAKGAFIERVVGTSSIWPVLHYDDAAGALDFLTSAFGFEVAVVVRGGDGDVGHCELAWPGGGRLNFGSTKHIDSVHGGTGAGVTACYLVTDDVDAVHERAVAEGAEIVQPPADTEFGTGVPTRAFTARDPEGNLWTFGTYRAV